MAQLTNTTIAINGNAINQFTSFSLSQGIFDHHSFRLICPAESIDGIAGLFNSSKGMMGATLVAGISSVGFNDQELKFSGIITQIETARFGGHHGDVIISGYSPTIVLDNGPHCKSWEKKAVKNIAQDVLKHFPQNLLNPKVAPLYGETLAYTVQYKETAWQFLRRICSTYGEWLFYDGSKLVIGPPQGATASLSFGSNLSRFNIALQVRPADLQMMSWDYMNSATYTSTPQGIAEKAGLNELGKQSYKASQAVYGTQPKSWNNQFLTNKKQQDDMVNIRSAMRSSSGVRFNGVSGQPGISVGGKVDIQGQNAFDSSAEAYGEFTVISVNHYVDSQGNYNNDFVAVPATIKVPPVNTIPEPGCETQSAIVTDNNDPRGLGRIRVKFHWMNGAEKSPWMRVTTPHAGGGKGMYFIPEVNEEVIAGFEGDVATKPYIIGAVYHSKANNTYGNAGNDVKALQSRSGNKVVLNDKDGSVNITDKGGADMLFDGAGNVITNAAATKVINVGGKKDAPPQCLLHMDKDGNVILDGKMTITFKVGLSFIKITEGKIVLNSDEIEINGKTVSTIKGSGAAKAVFNGSTTITGSQVDIN